MRVRNKFEPLAEYTPPTPHLASALPEEYEHLAAGLTDEQALKKIGQRSTTSGKIVTIVMIIGAVGLGAFYVQRSRTYDARMDGIEAAGLLERAEMVPALRKVLETSTYDDVRVRAIRNLAHFNDKDSVPLFIKALETPGVVRRAAALGLAEVGSPAADAAKPALMKALPDTDEKDRPQVVWALAVLKEPSATDAILDMFTRGLLQHQPNFDPKVITEAIGIEKLSSPELTGHEEKSVRTLVAVALAEAASPQVVDPLVRMLQRADEDSEVIRAAVAGLGRAGDPRAAQPLFTLMQNRADMRQSVVDALGRSTAAPDLAMLLKEAKDTDTKRDLVTLLHKTHDPRAADALASMLSEENEKIRLEAAQALAEVGDARAVPTLLTLAQNENDVVGNDAIDALRKLAKPEAGNALVGLLDKFPQRKSAIMRAIGTSGAVAAAPQLMRELKGDDIGAATKALGQLGYEKAYPVLVGMLKRDPKIDFSKPGVVTEMAYRNRLEAMEGLSYYNRPDPKAATALMTIIEDNIDDPRLRIKAGQTLGDIADGEIFAAILQKVSDANLDEESRVAYVQGLWRKPNPEVSQQLIPILSSDAAGTIKGAVALAIGYAGNPANDAQLNALLDDPQARRYAAFAATLGGSRAEGEKLLQVLPTDRDAEEVLRLAVNSNEDDNFNLLTDAMFESGQIYRRLAVAQVLRNGTAKISYSYPWTQVTSRLASGWDGPRGMSARDIRHALYATLTGNDPELRALVADAMASMNERGLLLAARDAGVEEARQQLLAMDRPSK